MKLTVLKEEELEDIKHFLETGKRKDGLAVTDDWIEKSLKKTTEEIQELKDRCEIHFQTAREVIESHQAAQKLYQAWKKGGNLEPLFETLGQALHS